MKKMIISILIATLMSNSFAGLPPVKITGQSYLTNPKLNTITANPVTLSGTHVTGVLPNAKTTAASANTPSAIVTRDGSGNFTAGTITGALTGNATTATTAGTVTTNANLTGPITSVGNATSVGSQTGSGSTFVMNTNPVLITPDIGVASGTSLVLSGLSPFATVTSDLFGNLVSKPYSETTQANSFVFRDASGLADLNGVGIVGTTSGRVSIAPQAASGTYNFNLPITAGSAGQFLTSQAGGSTAMTWGSNILGNAATVTTNANLTGPVTSVGNATTITSASITNAMLAGSIDLTSKVTGALPIANGGTASTTRVDAIASLLPSQTSQSGKFLSTTGSAGADPVWSLVPLATGISGTLPIANGGTAVTSVTTTPTASSFAGWDANSNLSANNHLNGWQTIATSAGTTTATIATPYQTYYTGTTTHTFKLPTTNVPVGGQYNIVNNSTGIVTVQSSGANTIQAMPAGSQLVATALVATPTTAANWNAAMTVNGLILGTTPTIQKFTSGSGNYTTSSGVSWIEVEMVGGGGGGGGAAAGNGGTGGTSTFGSQLSCVGGTGGAGAGGSAGGAGGTATLGTGPIGTALTGGAGAGTNNNTLSAGGMGGTNPLGGGGSAGTAGIPGGAGGAGAANTGAGGGGSGSSNTAAGSAGGGAGGYVKAIIVPTAGQVFAYVVGATGTAGSSTSVGGAGGSGYIKVTEYYPNTAVSSTLVGVAPTVSKATTAGATTGTGGFVSGTYTVPNGVQWFELEMVGGGGGGGGGGTATGTAGGNGGNTVFGTSTAGGGTGNPGGNVDGSIGGTATLGAGYTGTAISGGRGSGFGIVNLTLSGTSMAGGAGGNSTFGGNSANTANGAQDPAANTGGGGAGGSLLSRTGSSNFAGGGGGAGAYIKAIYIPTAGQTFSYSVGAFGTAGGAGTGGSAGANGSLGYIKITEYYTNLAVGTQAAIPANQFMAGPTSGSAAQPTFRAMVNADLPTIRSQVKVTTGNGYGSTNTVIRRFSTTEISTGTDITYADSASLGGTFTLNTAGIYTIEYQDAMGSASAFVMGISVNSNQLTTGIGTITAANRVAWTVYPSSTEWPTVISGTIIAVAGDVVRAHNQATLPTSSNANNTLFRVTKIGN